MTLWLFHVRNANPGLMKSYKTLLINAGGSSPNPGDLLLIQMWHHPNYTALAFYESAVDIEKDPLLMP